MRLAVLVKHVPSPEELRLEDGRLVREGVELEVSAFCRRANAKAVELAGPDGEVVVFTMGPPTAEPTALREMLACGATRGVHLCDPRFAGSDTLATARALAAAITAEGPFDLVLCGLNSLDADTGQVGPEVAELLGLPFAPGVRELELDGLRFHARLETDDGHRSVEGSLPVVLSTAERLCDPSKAGPEERALVDDDRITRRRGRRPRPRRATRSGQAGSPTAVGPVELHDLDPPRLADVGQWGGVRAAGGARRARGGHETRTQRSTSCPRWPVTSTRPWARSTASWSRGRTASRRSCSARRLSWRRSSAGP